MAGALSLPIFYGIPSHDVYNLILPKQETRNKKQDSFRFLPYTVKGYVSERCKKDHIPRRGRVPNDTARHLIGLRIL